MKFRFTPRAARDLAEIADYVREHSPQAALRVRAAILESPQRLVLFPYIGWQQKSGVSLRPVGYICRAAPDTRMLAPGSEVISARSRDGIPMSSP